MIKRRAGRPKKPSSQRVVKRMISISPKNHAYIVGIIEDRKMSLEGSYSKTINEIIEDHARVQRYKELERKKLEEKLEVLK